MFYSLDGITWMAIPDGLRVCKDLNFINGEDGKGELVFNFTHEGLIQDIWTNHDENVATSSATFEEIVEQMMN